MPGCVELQVEFESFSIRLVELCKFGRLGDGNLVNFEVSIELSEPYVRIGALLDNFLRRDIVLSEVLE